MPLENSFLQQGSEDWRRRKDIEDQAVVKYLQDRGSVQIDPVLNRPTYKIGTEGALWQTQMLPERAENAYRTSLDRWGQVGQFTKMLAVGDKNQTISLPVDDGGQPLPINDPRYKDWLVGQANEMAAGALTGGIPMAAKGAIGATGGALKIPPQAAPVFAPRIENPIRAYHGSPHDFDKFDLSKIGTGEGAQAYGHGLYFAENPGVAQSYRDTLAKQTIKSPTGQTITPGWDDPAFNAVQYFNQAGGDIDKAIELAKSSKGGGLSDLHWKKDIIGVLESYRGKGMQPTPPGRMYEVNIHARPEQMLNWDAPLSQQPQAVRDVLNSAGDLGTRSGFLAGPGEPSGANIYHAISPTIARTINSKVGPYTVYPQNEVAATQALREAGIPGIKYLDQGSRNVGQGTSNYVIFTPEIIDIVKKYGLSGLVALGAIDSSALSPQGHPHK